MRLVAALAMLAPLVSSCATPHSRSIDIAMWRLDCGTFDIDNYEGRGRVVAPVSCYLIRHGKELVLFDAGLDAAILGKPLRRDGQTLRLDHGLVEQLAAIHTEPEDVSTLIVSHYHADHRGQAELFSKSRLVIGEADAKVLRDENDQGGLAPWLAGQRKIEEIVGDRDLFADGSIRILHTPGHTPGHLSLLVRLKRASYILTGDLVHERFQLAALRPSGNHVDKVRGKAEIERVIELAKRESATIIVGHEKADVALLPAFPKEAR